jgi:hypothetical protein
VLAICQYVQRQHVERFIKCLTTELDPAKRTILLKLLIEVLANQANPTLETA